MGVLYHLRHPLLALDLIHEHVARDLLVFQSMQRGAPRSSRCADDYDFFEHGALRPARLSRSCTSSSTATPATGPTGGCRTPPAPRRCCAAPASRSSSTRRRRSTSAAAPSGRRRARRGLSDRATSGSARMIEAVMIWNEPNNKSHWDPSSIPTGSCSPRWRGSPAQAIRAENASAAARARRACRRSTRASSQRLAARACSTHVDVVAVHGFPLDWNLWQIDEWPAKLAEIRGGHRQAGLGDRGRRLDVRRRGGAGLGRAAHRRAADRPAPRASTGTASTTCRKTWEATTRHREAEGSSYYRHFYMGLLREDGTPKPALDGLRRLRARDGPLPVVPLRGPPARRGGRLDASGSA